MTSRLTASKIQKSRPALWFHRSDPQIRTESKLLGWTDLASNHGAVRFLSLAVSIQNEEGPEGLVAETIPMTETR